MKFQDLSLVMEVEGERFWQMELFHQDNAYLLSLTYQGKKQFFCDLKVVIMQLKSIDEWNAA